MTCSIKTVNPTLQGKRVTNIIFLIRYRYFLYGIGIYYISSWQHNDVLERVLVCTFQKINYVTIAK
jgi:hypothetical protein